jgi:hypothetical protein
LFLPLRDLRIFTSRLIFLGLTSLYSKVTWLQHLDHTLFGVESVDRLEDLGVLAPPDFLLAQIVRPLTEFNMEIPPLQVYIVIVVVVLLAQLVSLLGVLLRLHDHQLVLFHRTVFCNNNLIIPNKSNFT